MAAPSGEQHEITSGSYRAIVTESGGTLRHLTHDGRPLVDGFGTDEMSPGGRGQLLVPWPNRVRDGRFSHDGRDLQLPLSEPARHNASHGLVRWVAWTTEQQTADTVSLRYRLMAQTGWPWTFDLRVEYALTPDGLTVTQSAVNRSSESAPYAAGAHPYLCVGDGPVDHLELTLPAARRYLCDDRMLPVGSEPVAGTAYDFRSARLLGDTALDDGFTDLARDEAGRATTVLRDPATGEGVSLWADPAWTCLQVFTADEVPRTARRSLAVEPMTAPADALNSGDGLVVLDPGQEHTGSWGIRALTPS
jgi:aldose 1-epimerase